jgi:RNA polymerase sigma factor (sigma-70 family)
VKPGDLASNKEFLGAISISVKNIICSSFPHATPQEREDIEQEVKAKIWKIASSGKKVRNLRSYLWKVVYTTTLDVLGERLNMISLEDWSAGDRGELLQKMDLDSPAEVVERHEMERILDSAIESLPRKRRIVLRLYLAEMSIDEMADFLGWSRDKVAHLLYRGIDELKAKIGRELRIEKLKSQSLAKDMV